jgi:signal transduction histidine kinase
LGAGTAFTVSIPRGKDHLPQERIEAKRTLASSAIRADSYVEEALRWLPGAPEEAVPGIAERDLDNALVSGPSEGARISKSSAERPLVVVADDNADMLAYLIKLLQEHYRVRAVSNGVEALRQVRESNPDLIVTDIMMPGLDGLGLLQEIRKDPAINGKPVILLSARAGEEARIGGLQEGADDYIIKPFSARELLARVRSALTLARVRRELADKLEEQVRIRTQELEQRNAEVLEQTNQLRELSVRLLHAQDKERRRIARELHDSAGQVLAALDLDLGLIARITNNTQIAKTIENSKLLVTELTREIRTTSYLLHPPLLDEVGLASALRWYVEGLNKRSDIAVDLALPRDLARLSPELELALFRIVQECLTNIHRHSGSSTAQIVIQQDSETLVVEVKDQGQGIAPDKLSRIRSTGSGVGIRGMSERIRHLGGGLDIESSPGGTKVVVTFPLPKSIAAGSN